MSELTPEELKIIAEGMGFSVSASPNTVMISGESNVGIRWLEYNPLTNDTQCMEIMEKLKIELSRLDETWLAYIKYSIPSEGKTINAAVCQAALERFKEAK